LLPTQVNAQYNNQLASSSSLTHGRHKSKRYKPRYGRDVDFILANLTEGVKQEFEKAWDISVRGASTAEGLVLIYRKPDRSLLAVAQGRTSESRRVSFKWTSSVIAIVHTHPNRDSPRPSDHDVELSNRFQIPVFTITNRGMFVYDPSTGKISRVMNSLTWLPSKRSADWQVAANC